VDAQAFCLHHGLGKWDANLVAWLTQNHLVMSMTAQKKDVSDPDVINEFAQKVLTTDKSMLTFALLLTYLVSAKATLDFHVSKCLRVFR
jgi:[protein-PII] uridylyltransferase